MMSNKSAQTPQPSGTRRKPAWSEGKDSENPNSKFRIQNSKLNKQGRFNSFDKDAYSPHFTYSAYSTYKTYSWYSIKIADRFAEI